MTSDLYQSNRWSITYLFGGTKAQIELSLNLTSLFGACRAGQASSLTRTPEGQPPLPVSVKAGRPLSEGVTSRRDYCTCRVTVTALFFEIIVNLIRNKARVKN